MSRITLAGAVFLTVIATIPIVLSKKMNIDQNVAGFFGGTSILIAVGVLLDTMRQIESHLMMRHYDGFLKKGKIRGRFN
jgi:preprotein translocase subunit SecY